MERIETPAHGESRRSTEIPVPVATAPAPHSAETQCDRPSFRGTQGRREEEDAERIRDGRLRWRDGDQIERWVGSGLVVAERQFREVIGHRQIPLLLSSMANAVAKKPVAKKEGVA
jgi:hypothetical protein